MDESFFRTLRSDDYALLIGRLALALLFLPSGLQKLVHFQHFSSSLASKTLLFGMHFPSPELWAVIGVAIEVLAPLLLLLGVGARWNSLALVAFVIVATLSSHRYWEFEGAMRQAQAVNFYKNLGIIGGLLFLNVSGTGAISWNGVRHWRRYHHHPYQATHAA